MPSEKSIARSRWVLRIIILLQCYGLAEHLLFNVWETESNIYGLLFFDFKTSETFAKAVEDYGTWLCLMAAVYVVFAPIIARLCSDRKWAGAKFIRNSQMACLLCITFWFALYAALIAVRGGQFMSQWMLAAHAVRILTPIALILLLKTPDPTRPRRQVTIATWCLRIAIASTFFTHGLESIFENPGFINLLVMSAQQLLGYELAQTTATTLLVYIGIVDILVAALLLATSSRPLVAYMALWGIITACSRLTSVPLSSYSMVYWEVLVRIAHSGAPLVLLILFCSTAAERKGLTAKPEN